MRRTDGNGQERPPRRGLGYSSSEPKVANVTTKVAS